MHHIYPLVNYKKVLSECWGLAFFNFKSIYNRIKRGTSPYVILKIVSFVKD